MSKKVSSSRNAWAVQCQWPGEKPFLCGVMFWAGGMETLRSRFISEPAGLRYSGLDSKPGTLAL